MKLVVNLMKLYRRGVQTPYKSLAMRRAFMYWLVFVLCLSAGNLSVAASNAGFFVVNQWVEDYSVEARDIAAREALKEVLVRFCGREQALDNVALVPMLQNPEAYLMSFNYLTPVAEPSSDSGTATQAPSGFMLVFEFNGDQIRSYLIKSGLPIWSTKRPKVMIWWAVDMQGDRSILDATDDISLTKDIQALAHRRGVPLILPNIDAEDQQNLHVRDVWALDYDRLEVAARRYMPGAILVARTTQTLSGTWYAQWGVLFNGQLSTFDGKFDDTTGLAQQVINSLAESLAEQLAMVINPDGNDPQRFSLVIHNVTDLNDYTQVSAYLDQLMLVKRFGLSRVVPGQLIFDLWLQGSLEQFKRELSLEHRLIAFDSSATTSPLGQPSLNLQATKSTISPTLETSLEYRWRRAKP